MSIASVRQTENRQHDSNIRCQPFSLCCRSQQWEGISYRIVKSGVSICVSFRCALPWSQQPLNVRGSNDCASERSEARRCGYRAK